MGSLTFCQAVLNSYQGPALAHEKSLVRTCASGMFVVANVIFNSL